MELGALEVQIFVSLALVLGALFVAFVCDFLKGNNEALREKNIELSVRQEERERFEFKSTEHSRRRVVSRPSPDKTAPTPRFEPHPEPKKEPRPAPSWARPDELDEVDRLADRIRGRVEEKASLAASSPVPRSERRQLPEAPAPLISDPMNPPEERQESLISPPESDPLAPSASAKVTPIQTATPEPSSTREAVDLAEELARVANLTADLSAEREVETTLEEGTSREGAVQKGQPEQERPPAKTSQSVTFTSLFEDKTETSSPTDEEGVSKPVKTPRRFTSLFQLDKKPQETPAEPEPTLDTTSAAVEAEEPREAAASLEPESGETSEQATPQPEPEQASSVSSTWLGRSEPKQESEPAATSQPVSRLSIPAGIIDTSEFQPLLDSKEPFAGTVIAIGISGLDSAPWEATGASDFVKSALEPNDMACHTQDDEFIIVIPEEFGAAGQRRIHQVSQKLWDHQIRSVGRSPVMFSWGATDSKDESFADTVASARERMEQTRRNRERAPRKIHHYRAS